MSVLELEKRLRLLFEEQTGLERTYAGTIEDSGFDSLDAVEFVMAIEELLKREIPDADIEPREEELRKMTLAQLAVALHSYLNPSPSPSPKPEEKKLWEFHFGPKGDNRISGFRYTNFVENGTYKFSVYAPTEDDVFEYSRQILWSLQSDLSTLRAQLEEINKLTALLVEKPESIHGTNHANTAYYIGQKLRTITSRPIIDERKGGAKV